MSSRAAVAAGIRAVTVESLGELGRLERHRTRGRPAPAGAAPRGGVGGRPARTRPARRRRRGRQVRDGRGRPDRRRAAGRARPRISTCSGCTRSARRTCSRPARSSPTSPRPAHARARARAAAAGTTVRIVDAGGGLGIPYEPHEESLDLVGLGRGLARHRPRLGDRSLPGRGAARARARSLPGRPGGRLPRPGRRHARPSTGRRSRSSTAASTTSCDRRWSARSTGSGCSAALERSGRTSR